MKNHPQNLKNKAIKNIDLCHEELVIIVNALTLEINATSDSDNMARYLDRVKKLRDLIETTMRGENEHT